LLLTLLLSLLSRAGSYRAKPTAAYKAQIGFPAQYQKGFAAPQGNAKLKIKDANFKFESTSYDSLVITDTCARLKGSGTVKDKTGTYKFLLTACDYKSKGKKGKGTPDIYRMKITDPANVVVYDNKPSCADADFCGTDVAGGRIVVNK
jgi:hypothetical protein